MNGLELSRGYFEEYGRAMLENDFKELLPYIAVGFTGSGSEHYGFDDDISRDHDYEPGFCVFLPDEDTVDRRNAFLLERAYAKLPKEYCGIKRQPVSPVGGSRHGVLRTGEFFLSAVGSPDGELTVDNWLHIPDYALAEAVNGEIFFDRYGQVTAIRDKLKNMPSDVLLKRLAGNLLIMAQSGQYNFVRCLRHGENDAAQLACFEFVNAAMKTVFLLHGEYMPYYKWSFHALRLLDGTDEVADRLSFLLKGDNGDNETAEKKYEFIEKTASDIIELLKERDITSAVCGDLERHAYSVNDKIKDSGVRNMHILTAV